LAGQHYIEEDDVVAAIVRVRESSEAHGVLAGADSLDNIPVFSQAALE
jgi:hypothetical protein